MKGRVIVALTYCLCLGWVSSYVPISRSLYSPYSCSTNVIRLHSNSADWFKQDGLAFSCSMCGACCSGSTGSVRFTDQEAERMALKLGISVDDFMTKYTRRIGKGATSRSELKEIRVANSRSYDCVFLDRSAIPGKAICALYDARPLQCKTWPFWPEVLESPETWELAKRGAEGCPGIGKGSVIPYDEIVRQRDNSGL